MGASGGGSATKALLAELAVAGIINHPDGVTLDINEGALTIQDGGRYTLGGAGATISSDFRLTSAIDNHGQFVAEGDSAALRSDFYLRDGELAVTDGLLRMEGVLAMEGGHVRVDAGATLEMAAGTALPPENHEIIVRNDGALRGNGELRIKAGSLAVRAGQTLTTELGLFPNPGMIVLQDGVALDGEGILLNRGRLVVNEATSKLEIVNEGNLKIGGAEGVTNLRAVDGTIVNRSAMRIDGRLEFDSAAGATRTVALTNEAFLTLGGGSTISSLQPELRVQNAQDGFVIKELALDRCAINCFFDSAGRLYVQEGDLTLTAGGVIHGRGFDSPSVKVSTFSRLVLNNDTGGLSADRN